MPVLTTHALAMAGLAARRAWLHHVDTTSLQGSDRHMLRWCLDEDRRAYAMFHISFGCRDQAAWDAVQAQILADIAADLRDPRSPFKRDVDHATARFTWRDGLELDGLVEVVDDDDAFFHVGDATRRPLVIRLHRRRWVLGVLFDHTCWDGVRIVNEVVTRCIRCRAFDTKWLAPARYTPVLDEALQIYTAYVMGYRWMRHDPMATYREDEAQHVVRHHLRTADVKATKTRLGVPFSAAIVGLYAERVLRWTLTKRDRIRFGVIVGCVSDRFRNNYSIMTIDVHRAHGVDGMIRDVARQMKRRRVEVLPLFNLIGSLEIETLFKAQMIDVLFSPAFFDRGEGISLSVDDMSFFNVPSSVPLYSFACSIDDLITISSTLNTPEISLDRMLAEDDAREVYRYDARRRIQPQRMPG